MLDGLAELAAAAMSELGLTLTQVEGMPVAKLGWLMAGMHRVNGGRTHRRNEAAQEILNEKMRQWRNKN